MTGSWYHCSSTRIVLTLHVQPGAKRTEVVGYHDGALKIKVAAPPVEGQANAKLLEFLKKAFDVPASQVVIKHGGGSRRKVVEILDSQRSPEDLLGMGNS